MTKNEIYTIRGLLDQAKAKTLSFIGRLMVDLENHPENEEGLKESILIHTKVYNHYDQCLESLNKLTSKTEKEGE